MPDSQFILDLRKRLQSSVNPVRLQHMRRMQKHLLGRDFDDDYNPKLGGRGNRLRDSRGRYVSESVTGSGVGQTGTLPAYNLITRTPADYLKANKMLNNLRVLVAQTRAIDIVPEWKYSENELIKSGRKAWWEQRAQGIDGYGGWKDDLDRCFMDFAALGLGTMRIHVAEYEDGNRVEPKYVSPLNVIFDPYAAHVESSKECTFITIMSIEDAEERFENFNVDLNQSTQTFMSPDGVAMEGVRVIEWYHIVEDDFEHTYVAMLNDFGGEVLESGYNPFGCLPIGIFPNFQPPGASFPIGLVEMEVYESRELDNEDEWIRTAANRESQLGVTPGFIHSDDMERIAQGEDPQYIRVDVEKAVALMDSKLTPFYQIPRNPVSDDHWRRRELLAHDLDTKSGVSANAQGAQNGSGAPITATEVDAIKSSEGVQTSFLSREFARGYQSFAVKIGKAAKKYDTAPFTTAIKEVPVLWNGADKRLSSKTLWDGPLSAVIGDEELMTSDVNNKQNQAAIKAQAWLNACSNPAMIIAKSALIKYGEALGITNPEADIPLPPAPPAVDPAMMGGMPPQGAMQ